MSENNIELPQSVLVEIRNLLQATFVTHSVPQPSNITVNVIKNSYFDIDNRAYNLNVGSPTFDFGELFNASGALISGQFALWVDRSAFVDPARKIAIDRFIYLRLSIRINPSPVSRVRPVLESVFPYAIWGGENFIGFSGRTRTTEGTINFVNFDITFRVDQRHINRLSRFLYPPGIQQHQLERRTVVLSDRGEIRSNLTVLNDFNMTRGPSAPLYSPAVKTMTFTIPTSGTPKAMISRHPARTNAANTDWNAPTFVAARYYGGIPSSTTNYNNLFVKVDVPGAFTYATAIDAAGETDPNAETSLTCAASLTSTMDLDCPLIMPRYTNSGQTNPGVNFSITLTAGASTCYILDYGITPSANLASYAHLLSEQTARIYTNNRFFSRGFYTLTRGTAKTVTITRGMMILFPSANTATTSTFSLSYS